MFRHGRAAVFLEVKDRRAWGFVPNGTLPRSPARTRQKTMSVILSEKADPIQESLSDQSAPLLFRLPDRVHRQSQKKRLDEKASASSVTKVQRKPVEAVAVRVDSAVSQPFSRQNTEDRLDRLVSASTGRIVSPRAKSRSPESWLDHHATDLIDRLTDWSSDLDDREAELVEREAMILSRMRELRRKASLEQR